MDDVVNRFARELADSIAAAVSESAEVEACRERARAAGYEMKVNLEAVVGFVNRQPQGEGAAVEAKVAAATRALVPRKPYDMTVNDRRFLRSLRIAAEEAKVEEAELARSLFRDRFRCLARRFGVAQVAAPHRLEVRVQFVDQRDPRRDVQLHDGGVRDAVEVLDQRAQRVAVRRDQHALALADRPGRWSRASRAGSAPPCP